jgi:glycosyltransferase involved in cell wall biosynthesis
MSILVLTADPLPLPGLAATGAGLRAWGLAEGLKSVGIEARAVMPNVLLAGRADPRDPAYAPHVYPAFDAAGYVRDAGPEAVVVQHWGMLDRLASCPCPLALDLAGPHLLERRHWGQSDLSNDLDEKIQALARADHVVCSGRDQRLYFLPWLIQAGFDPADPGLCPTIPFSWSPEGPGPRAQAPGQALEPLFLSGGVLLPWQDPRPGIQALLEAMDQAGRGRLLFCAGAHPVLNVAGGEHHDLLDLLQQHPRAETNSLVAFDDWLKMLQRVDAAFDLLAHNNEREIAFPTRTALCLWAGLPVIHADYDELGRMIRQANAGWALDPEDLDAVRQTVVDILKEPASLTPRAEAARRLGAERLNWRKTIEPLARFCRNPKRRRRSPAAGRPPTARRIEALERELAAAREETAAVLGRWPLRWARRLKRLAWAASPLIYIAAFLAAATAAACALLADLFSLRSGKIPSGK